MFAVFIPGFFVAYNNRVLLRSRQSTGGQRRVTYALLEHDSQRLDYTRATMRVDHLGSRMSMNSRTRNVGMGSRDDDVTGDIVIGEADALHCARTKGRQ